MAATALEHSSDEELVTRGTGQGDRAAVETLLGRHQTWLYNLALYMLQSRADAEDATQEILVKVTTRLATFRHDSRFRTWAYRIAVNHIIDRKRSQPEATVHGFACYGDYLDRAPDGDVMGLVPDLGASPAEVPLLIEEAKILCTMGLLLCLDREQRVTFVLGEILEATDAFGADVLGIGREAFRQRLARARGQLTSFLGGRCGLLDASNPCRCARKTRAFIAEGIVDRARLQFAGPHVARVRAEAPVRSRALATALFGDVRLFGPPVELRDRLRALVADSAPRHEGDGP
jgi:RNA polymerase sigma factor (sigma-70 family)